MGEVRPASLEEPAEHQPTEPIVLGLLAAPGVAHDLAAQLAQELLGRLGERYPEIAWKVVVDVDSLAGAAGVGEDLMKLARRADARRRLGPGHRSYRPSP
jgi:hypothetical protein